MIEDGDLGGKISACKAMFWCGMALAFESYSVIGGVSGRRYSVLVCGVMYINVV